ncbi:MAG: hydantoin utilization protein A, partial [Methanomicrobiales archaeon HGW-Methanomicrobiales-4]
GTNTDIAVIDGDIRTVKVPNSRGISHALKEASPEGRLAVSTSQPLNALVTGSGGTVRTITIPGPGLVYGGAIKGAVSPRGEILEAVDTKEIEQVFRSCHSDAIAIAGKFSVRNPVLEEIVRDIGRHFYDDERIAISAPLGGLNFPARINTTRINAKIKAKVVSLVDTIKTGYPDFLFVTSDGGLCGPVRAIDNPSLLYHSSPATVALGAGYLSGKKDCLVVDIGGTTTDLVPLSGGNPVLKPLFVRGERTLINAVVADSIPLGGDSCIRDELLRFRAGNARAFGGGEPTLTDALNVLGADIGDRSRSICLDQDKAEHAVSSYIDVISRIIHKMDPKIIIGTGFLAPYLIPDLAGAARTPYVVPDHAQSANAVGAAVSRISISMHAHADSGRGVLTLNGTDYPLLGKVPEDELISYASDIVRKMARQEGAPPGDLHDIAISQYSTFHVVRGGRVQARITDFLIGIAPGVTVEAP